MSERGKALWPGKSLPQIAPDVLTEILAKATDLAIVVDLSGTVLSVLINQNNRSFGRLDHWQGRDLRDFLTSESLPKLDAKLAACAAGEDMSGGMELNHSDNARWEFPIRYTLHRLADDAILMLGRDLRPIAEVQLQLAKAQIALERDHEAQREFDTRYRVLLNVTRDAIVFMSLGNGRIADLNAAAAQVLGSKRDKLIGASLASELTGGRDGEVIDALTRAVDEAPVDIRIKRTGESVSISPTLFRAAGERMLICRLERNADSADGMGTTPDELSQNLNAFYQSGAEAIVFTDRAGAIRSANDSFLELIEIPDLASIKGRPLGDFMARGGIDLRILTENAARAGQMRAYATKIQGAFGAEIAADVSVTFLTDSTTPAYVFIIRDTSRTDSGRNGKTSTASLTGPDESGRSVVDLVGATTLKDIVAETTDVIEKMCIETAVELTGNNRVAAAEMLGLSRQSLYVKLRKYGLL